MATQIIGALCQSGIRTQGLFVLFAPFPQDCELIAPFLGRHLYSEEHEMLSRHNPIHPFQFPESAGVALFSPPFCLSVISPCLSTSGGCKRLLLPGPRAASPETRAADRFCFSGEAQAACRLRQCLKSGFQSSPLSPPASPHSAPSSL